MPQPSHDKPNFADRTLTVILRHDHHKIYVDNLLTPACCNFISDRRLTSTPGEIYRELQAFGPVGWDKTTAEQVYYQWQKANASNWRKHNDASESAFLLGEESPLCTAAQYSAGTMRAVAIYVTKNIELLSASIEEIAMDSTYGTNSSGAPLFAVLAEYDGSGFPLAYCFIET